MHEVVALAFEQNGFQISRSVESLARNQFAGGVDREFTFLLAPLANAVEILQTETNRVHARVAGRAHRVLAMLLHALAKRAGERRFFAFLQFGHVGRRGRGRCAEEVFEHPFATFDRRSARGSGSHGENACLRQQTSAMRSL